MGDTREQIRRYELIEASGMLRVENELFVSKHLFLDFHGPF